MSKDKLTGDFITDHPLATLFLGGCLLELLSSEDKKSVKDRYEIEQAERRKQAFRDEFMQKNPIVWPHFLDEFCQFSFELSKEQIVDTDEKNLFLIWNRIHTGFWHGTSHALLSDDTIEKNMEKIVIHWTNSDIYKDLRKQTWQNYVYWVDNQLILQGKI